MPNALAANPLSSCQLPQADMSKQERIGWPKYPGLISTQGKPKFLVVGIDFPDAPMNSYGANHLEDLLGLQQIPQRYEKVSGGRFKPSFEVFPNWIRMPLQSNYYGNDAKQVQFINGQWGTHLIEHDVTSLLKSEIDLNKYDGLIVFISGGVAISGEVSYATPLDGGTSSLLDGGGNYIDIGVGMAEKLGATTWKAVVHEINHLLGLEDLYLYQADGYWLGRTPGPFGVQAFVYESSSDALGWNRWLNGWISDSQIDCEPFAKTIKNVQMNPPYSNAKSGYQLLIIRLSDFKVLVMESLAAKGYAAATLPNSVLTYTVDSATAQGDGPVNIVPRPTKLTESPLSPDLPDWKRFVQAPLIPGTYTQYGDYLIYNQASSGAGEVVSVYYGKDAKLAKVKIDSLISQKLKKKSTTKK